MNISDIKIIFKYDDLSDDLIELILKEYNKFMTLLIIDPLCYPCGYINNIYIIDTFYNMDKITNKHFNMNKTLMLYIKTFKSIPNEKIWQFKKELFNRQIYIFEIVNIHGDKCIINDVYSYDELYRELTIINFYKSKPNINEIVFIFNDIIINNNATLNEILQLNNYNVKLLLLEKNNNIT